MATWSKASLYQNAQSASYLPLTQTTYVQLQLWSLLYKIALNRFQTLLFLRNLLNLCVATDCRKTRRLNIYKYLANLTLPLIYVQNKYFISIG